MSSWQGVWNVLLQGKQAELFSAMALGKSLSSASQPSPLLEGMLQTCTPKSQFGGESVRILSSLGPLLRSLHDPCYPTASSHL